MDAKPNIEPAEVPGFDQMHDIVMPDPVSWWPLAPGWWVVLLILAIGILWLGVTIYHRWQQNAHRRAALLELDHTPPQELSALLKRVCLSEFPRDRVAPLSGQAWLEFLDQTGSTDAFTRGNGRHLIDLSYNPNSTAPDGVKQTVRQWLLHRPKHSVKQFYNPSREALCRTDLQSVDSLSRKE